MGREHEKRNYGTAAAKSQVVADGGGGGGAASFVDDDLTSGSNLTKSYGDDAEWLHDSGGVYFTDLTPGDHGSWLHSVAIPDVESFYVQVTYTYDDDSGGWEYVFCVLADSQSAGVINDAWGIRYVSGAQAIYLVRRSGGGNTLLDTYNIGRRLVDGDVIKIKCTKNGSNWDLKGYLNGTERLSADNQAHTGNLGSKIGVTAYGYYHRFKDLLGGEA